MSSSQNVNQLGTIVFIMVIFFTISFITNILNSIIVDVRESFDLSLGLAGLLPFSFFIAYGVMSIPAGFLTERFSNKTLLTFSFFVIIISCLTFVIFPIYLVFSFTLFFLGCSMAILQVVINPMLRTAGGEEHFAYNSVLAQLAFGLASFASPYLYIYLVNSKHRADHFGNLLRGLAPQDLPWVSLYLIFSVIAMIMLWGTKLVKYPNDNPSDIAGKNDKTSFKSLIKNKFTLLYFTGIFCYVGVEQGIGNWISQFLNSYHNLDPQTIGASTVSYFWAMLTAGCLLGLLLLKLYDSRNILIGSTILTIVTLLLALYGPVQVTLLAFPAAGFFISVMWSIIFSLGLNSVGMHHGALSGILCTGIAGGAIAPLVVGIIGDNFNLKIGLLFLMLPLAFILSIGFWAKPLVSNLTIGVKKD